MKFIDLVTLIVIVAIIAFVLIGTPIAVKTEKQNLQAYETWCLEQKGFYNSMQLPGNPPICEIGNQNINIHSQ